MENTKEKLKSWLANRYNLALVGILVLSFIIRMYYFFLTKNQPLWYDEAEYLNAARTWAFSSPVWQLAVVRPVLLPFIFSILYRIGFGETTFRLLIMLSSLGAIFLIYLVGKKMYNEKTGIIAAFLLSAFWSFTFFSFRILVDVPVAFFWLLALYLFLAYYGKNDRRLWLFGFFLALGFLAKFTVSLLGFVILIFLVFTERAKFLKNKNLWIAFLVILLAISPFLIYEYVEFGNPLAFYIKVANTPQPVERSFLMTLFDFLKFSFPLIHSVFFYLALFSLVIVSGRLFIYFDLFIKRKSSIVDYDFLLILWLILPFLYIVKIGYGHYIEERWLFMFYPALFLASARGIEFLYGRLKGYSKSLAIAIILAILLFGGYQNVTHANQIIKAKSSDSFILIKQAGEWLNENTNPGEVILATSMHAELQYHSNRQAVNTGDLGSNEALEKLMKEKTIRYYVLSFFFQPAEFQMDYLKEHASSFVPVRSYGPYINQEQSIQLLTILKIKKTNATAP